jgi:hypothetical protein
VVGKELRYISKKSCGMWWGIKRIVVGSWVMMERFRADDSK